MIPFEEFLERTRLMSREEFLGQVTVPHLFLAAMPLVEEGAAKFRTAGFSALMIESDGKPVLFPLEKQADNAFAGMITLGRARNNDVVLGHAGVSKFHGYFRRVGDAWSVCDADSSFGIYVDGARIEPQTSQPVVAGTRVCVAADESGKGLQFEFLTPEALYDRVGAS
jgi:hypothetical protein